MKTLPCFRELKICVYESSDYPGNSYLKIYDQNATREHMTARLKELTGLGETVIIATEDVPDVRYGTWSVPAEEGPSAAGPSRPDILVDHFDGDHALKAMERRFEPYFWEK